jgi:hypothetical protein
MIQLVLGAVARPTLRLGGEWAGWRCAFNARNGALLTEPIERYCSDSMIEWGQCPGGFEDCTTETWQGDTILRRSVQLLPEDGCNVENLGAIVIRSALPPAQSVKTDSKAEALACAWALDEMNEAGLWRCETVFDGLGGERPKPNRAAVECPIERTRISCSFDPLSGTLAVREPVLVWQERCWSATPSEEFRVQEDSGSRSGLDAAWVSSVVGFGCFAEEEEQRRRKREQAQQREEDKAGASHDTPPTLLQLAGGVQLCAVPGKLEVMLSCSPEQPDSILSSRKVLIRRTWDQDGSCVADLEVLDHAT